MFCLISSMSVSTSVSSILSHSEGLYVQSFRESGVSSRSIFRFSTLSYEEFRSLYKDSHVSGDLSNSGYLSGSKDALFIIYYLLFLMNPKATVWKNILEHFRLSVFVIIYKMEKLKFYNHIKIFYHKHFCENILANKYFRKKLFCFKEGLR